MKDENMPVVPSANICWLDSYKSNLCMINENIKANVGLGKTSMVYWLSVDNDKDIMAKMIVDILENRGYKVDILQRPSSWWGNEAFKLKIDWSKTV